MATSLGKLPLTNTLFYAVWWPGKGRLLIFCTMRQLRHVALS